MTKLEAYTQMADHATEKLTAEMNDWLAFLRTASRIYKYSFMEQVMIYTQRPNATACASYDLWDKRMRRYVRRGASGIAIIRTIGARSVLYYVFDVPDTGKRQDGIDPYLWRIDDQNAGAVSVHLENCFGVSADRGLADQLIRIAVQLADARWSDCRNTVRHSVSGSLLEELDDYNTEILFRQAVTASIAYALLYRCGIDTRQLFTLDDFAAIGNFNTRDTVALLGKVVTESCESVLRQIERAILAYNAGKPIQRKTPPQPSTPAQSAAERVERAEASEDAADIPAAQEAAQEPRTARRS